MMICRPHRWDIEHWLPILSESRPEEYDAITCLNCGRVLAIKDTSPNMRSSIADSIAKKFLDGDEYAEVCESVMEFFNSALTRYRFTGRH